MFSGGSKGGGIELKIDPELAVHQPSKRLHAFLRIGGLCSKSGYIQAHGQTGSYIQFPDDYINSPQSGGLLDKRYQRSLPYL